MRKIIFSGSDKFWVDVMVFYDNCNCLHRANMSGKHKPDSLRKRKLAPGAASFPCAEPEIEYQVKAISSEDTGEVKPGQRNKLRLRRKKLTPREKADLDMFLSMRELSVVTGFGENRLNELKMTSGFPLVFGKTTLSKFREWAFAQTTQAAQTLPDSHTAEHPPRSNAGRSYAPFR